MSSPPPKSLVPASSPPTVWPPSNPSGTVIPFPLPWGQTGCCPPGGMDALMKCYCDIQQASAFIGQIMLDQINNNPAIIAAIIAGIEASGSSLPTIGVTNGQPAQPGQVGEYIQYQVTQAFPINAGNSTYIVSAGVLPPGDWDCFAWVILQNVQGINFGLSPIPTGFSSGMGGELYTPSGADMSVIGLPTEALISVPSLLAFQVVVTGATVAGTLNLVFSARRAR